MKHLLPLTLAATLFACSQKEPDPTPQSTPSETPTPAEGSTRVPGTSISLVPPPDFLPAKDFPGYLHPETQASVMISEVPAPYSEALAGLKNPAKLMTQGMTLVSSESKPMGSVPGTLARITQKAQNATAEKWIWTFGTSDRTVMILATAFDKSQLPSLLQSIQTATWDQAHTVDKSEGLGFTLTPGKLVLLDRMGDMLMYTQDGKPDLTQSGKPMFLAGPSTSAKPIPDQEAFAKSRATELPLTQVQVQSTQPITIDGLTGIALKATAKGTGGEGDRFIYQVILFEPERYWILVGIGDPKHKSEYLPEFQSVASTFRRTQDL